MSGTRVIEATGALYVVATDSFMSGWGGAQGGRSLYAIACKDDSEANDVYNRMQYRSEMKRIRISASLPKTRTGDHLKVIAFSDFTYKPDYQKERLPKGRR